MTQIPPNVAILGRNTKKRDLGGRSLGGVGTIGFEPMTSSM